MTGLFEERERGYEAKWAHDEETLFKIQVRRNELLGRWAAGEMGLSAAAAADYVKAVIDAGVAAKGADPAFEKIRDDFAAGKIPLSEQALARKAEEFFTAASREAIKRDRLL
ncbi:MAG: DUF1476 domain-containing protein [Rhizomicrobium sp.]